MDAADHDGFYYLDEMSNEELTEEANRVAVEITERCLALKAIKSRMGKE